MINFLDLSCTFNLCKFEIKIHRIEADTYISSLFFKIFMAQLTGLGIENFRVFKEYTEFDFAPITLLTGANNSGKSSLIKALLLLAMNAEDNGLKEFDTTNDVFYLGSYDTIKSFNSESNEIKFSLKYSFSVDRESDFAILFTNTMLTYEFDEYGIKNFVFESFMNNEYVKVYSFERTEEFMAAKYWNLQLLLNLIYEDKTSLDTFVEIIDTDKIREELHLLSSSDIQEFINSLNENILNLLSGNLASSKSRYFVDWINFDSIHFIYADMVEKDFAVDYSINEMFSESEKLHFHHILSLVGDNTVHSYLSNLHGDGGEDLISNLVEDFNVDMKKFFGTCKSILPFQYVANVKSNIKRIYPFNDKNSFSTLLKDYKKYNDKIVNNDFWKGFTDEILQVNSFVSKWLETFGIGTSINIEEERGFGLSVSISQLDGRKTLLADLGYGYTQIIVMLLSILRFSSIYTSSIYGHRKPNYNKEINKTIILEEPETNLHPNLQSKLADFLIDAHQTFGINFIVETHSEYLIRKLRVLTKKNVINKEDCVIYYFQNSETLQEGEELARKIQINPDGFMTDDFGDGFTNEADNLMIELYDLPKRQN